jgi:hypothetical protein
MSSFYDETLITAFNNLKRKPFLVKFHLVRHDYSEDEVIYLMHKILTATIFNKFSNFLYNVALL